MNAIQRFRAKVNQVGNLQTNEKITIIKEKEVIRIESASPEVIYVPVYTPSTVIVRYETAPAYPLVTFTTDAASPVRRSTSNSVAVPRTLVENVSSGSSYDSRTTDRAARWKMVSGRHLAITDSRASLSRTSPRIDSIPSATRARSNRLGSVGGSRA